jgi:hypothetical protein
MMFCEHADYFRRTELFLRKLGDFDGARFAQELADACERNDLLQLKLANQAMERLRAR